MKRETHRKVGHTLISSRTVVYLCVCALLDWIPQYLGGLQWCIPSTEPTKPCSHSALNCLWRYENERIALSSPSFTIYLPDFYKTQFAIYSFVSIQLFFFFSLLCPVSQPTCAPSVVLPKCGSQSQNDRTKGEPSMTKAARQTQAETTQKWHQKKRQLQ